jgi:hypothetical protein
MKMTPSEKIKKEFDKMTNRGWFVFPEETWSFFEHALKEEYKRGQLDALDEDIYESETRADIAKENYSQGYIDCLKGRKKAPHDARDGWCCACSYDLAVLEVKIKDAKGEVIEEIKKKLPTHKGNILTRNEVKKLLDSINK